MKRTVGQPGHEIALAVSVRLRDVARAETRRILHRPGEDREQGHPEFLAELDGELDAGLEGVSEADTRKRLLKVERAIGELTRGGKLYGHLYDDLLKLKYLHQRYTNYLRWLKTQ